MKYLLIQSYMFERSVLPGITTMAVDLTYLLQPLEKLRGLEICHIRAMKICHWPYLRFLEKEIMRSCDDAPGENKPGQRIENRAVLCKEALRSAGTENASRNPDDPHPNKLFDLFDIEPLYSDVDFLEYYNEDTF